MNRAELLAWLETVPEDEPVFCMRAKDTAVPGAMRKYIARCESLGSPKEHVDACKGFNKEIVDWRVANKKKCKVPD